MLFKGTGGGPGSLTGTGSGSKQVQNTGNSNGQVRSKDPVQQHAKVTPTKSGSQLQFHSRYANY